MHIQRAAGRTFSSLAFAERRGYFLLGPNWVEQALHHRF
jgi:hypothetical protein